MGCFSWVFWVGLWCASLLNAGTQLGILLDPTEGTLTYEDDVWWYEKRYTGKWDYWTPEMTWKEKATHW